MLIDLVKPWLRKLFGTNYQMKILREPAVIQWDKVIHKGARTEEGQLVGYIAADDEESIIILASGFREYKIPKSHIKTFGGSQIYFDIPLNVLEQFRIV